MTMNLSLPNLQNHLQNHFSTTVTLTSIDPQLIGLGRGYLSNVFSVGLEWSVDDDTLPTSVVVKELNLQILAPELDEATGLPKAKDSHMSLSGFDKPQNTECSFYEIVKQSGFPAPLPACYGYKKMSVNGDMTKEKPYIILEDLSPVSHQVTYCDGLNENQIMNVLEQIAKVQAWSIKNPDWHIGIVQNNVTKNDGGGDSVFFDSRTFSQLCQEFHDVFIPNEMTNRFTSDQLAKLRMYLQSDTNSFAARDAVHRDFHLPNTLDHGDLSANNILFGNGTTNSTNTVVALLDWQFVGVGTPISDVMRLFIGDLLSQSMSRETRKMFMMKGLRHFYVTLTECFDGHPPFEFDTFIEAYERTALIHLSIFLPMWVSAISRFRSGRMTIAGMNGEKAADRLKDDLEGLLLYVIELGDNIID